MYLEDRKLTSFRKKKWGVCLLDSYGKLLELCNALKTPHVTNEK